MDIRNFFKAAGKTGAPGPKKPKQEVKQEQQEQPAVAAPAGDADPPATASNKAATPSKKAAGGGSQPSAGGGGGSGGGSRKVAAADSRKRKKRVVDSSDSDVEIVGDDDSDSDDDYDAMSLDDEEDDEAIDVGDDSSDDDDAQGATKPKPAKRAKPSPASGAAAAAAGGGAKAAAGGAKKAAAGKAAGAKKAPAAKGGAKKGGSKKADRPAMVIEKNSPGSAEKKRKLPGSMAGQLAPQVAAPKSASKSSSKSKAADKAAKLSDDAKTAMALVEATAEELPVLTKDDLTFAPSGIFGGGVANVDEREPPNPGSKPVVRGHPDAFTDKTFVFSGVLSSLFRDQATDLVLSHGARVTKDVSGKTSFLVVGDQCSRRKFELQHTKGFRVIDEDGLLALCKASAALVEQPEEPDEQQQQVMAVPSQQQAAAGVVAVPSQPSQAAAAGGASGGQQLRQPQFSQQQPSQPQQQPSQLSPGGRAAVAVPAMSALAFHGGSSGGGAGWGSGGGAAGRSGGAGAAAAAGAGPSAQPSGGGAGSGGPVADTLWVEKYKPTSSAELVGNNGLVATLRQWLFQWDNVHLRGAIPVQAKAAGSYQSKPKDMSKKAVLLSGPPGIGKTSSAHIIAKELGYQVVEVNASDARGKSDNKAGAGIAGKLANVVREMVTSTALAAASGVKRKQILVMDEVDGMSAGDRGGVADLIQTIKLSKIPIICICNDKYAQKLRSLRNHCLELDYRKPTAQQVAVRMSQVCSREGLYMNEATLRTLIEGAQGDLRLVLGQLQMARLRTARLDYDAAKAMSAISKDADMSPFSACAKLLESRSMGGMANPPSLTDQLEWVFADAGLVPLLVQENYANHSPDITRGRPIQFRLRTLAKAADAISIGDVVDRQVRRNNQWGLMPFGAMMGAVVPATYMRGGREVFNEGEQNFTRFSTWFGNYSHGNKQQRLLAELSCAMAAGDTAATCSRNSVRLDYLPALRQVLTRPLSREGEAAIPTVISTMQAYCINREQFDYVIDVTKFKSKAAWAEDPTKDIDTKTKSAFTRTFNKQGLKARTNTMVSDVVKGRGKGKSKAAAAAAAAAATENEFEEQDTVAGDAEGGAALAEEGSAGPTQAARADEPEEDLTPEQLAARMQHEGIQLQLKAPAAGGAKSGGRGSGRGRGGGRSGAGASGRGRSGGKGRGRGK